MPLHLLWTRQTLRKRISFSSRTQTLATRSLFFDRPSDASHRVWKAEPSADTASSTTVDDPPADTTPSPPPPDFWTTRALTQYSVDQVVEKISPNYQMRQTQMGVLHRDPSTDMQLLCDNYTVRAIASALRDREDALQHAASLAANQQFSELADFLRVFHPKYIVERRSTYTANADPVTELHKDNSRQMLRKCLMRMPRTVSTAFTKRAGVCLALCLVEGVPCLLLEKRSEHLRAHPAEVCLPGGMVCDIRDQTIVSTSIREMKEEIGGLDGTSIEVLGVLRLNWGEVHHLTGVAVTPVVCYLGELPEQLSPNPDEVSEAFTVPLSDLMENNYWVSKEGQAPIFLGGPHVIWGLTGYILDRFRKDVLRPLQGPPQIT